MYSRFLSELLVANRLSGRGKYYAREVSIDYGTSKVKRIDFMQFEPAGVIYQGDIEKGIFTCYEVKSCREDVYSGNGLNFLGGKELHCYYNAVLQRFTRRYEKWKALESYTTMLSGIIIAFWIHSTCSLYD